MLKCEFGRSFIDDFCSHQLFVFLLKMFQVLKNFTIVNKIVLNSISRTIVGNAKTVANLTELNFKTKVPQQVVKTQFDEFKNEKIKITESEIILLERLSLVDLDRK